MPRPKKPRPWTLTGVVALLVYGEPADRSTPFHRPAWTRLDAHDGASEARTKMYPQVATSCRDSNTSSAISHLI